MMTKLLTAKQMQTVEKAAINSGEVSGLELMERAGRSVVEAISEEWPELTHTPHKAVVLCGPGNNGGDGFVVARLLYEQGWQVDVYLLGNPENLPNDAKTNYERWVLLGACSELTNNAINGYAGRNPGTAVAVDALFGTGLCRPFMSLEKVQMELNYWHSAWKTSDVPRVVSVDIPSGICSDSGKYLGYEKENPFDYAIMSNLTVSFHAEKCGHRLAQGPYGAGKTVVKPIGLDPKWNKHAAGKIAKLNFPDSKMQHHLCKADISHKYAYGHALVLCGGSGQTGAARLAARGALRIGAGLVTLGVPEDARQEVACQITAIMMKRVGQATDLNELLKDTRFNAICIGPGLGQSRARELLPVVLQSGRLCVLDADALTAYQDNPEALFDMLHENCILTPHEGEFSRLFPDISAKLNAPAMTGPAYSKVNATREAAQRAGCVVLFKGPDTVIAAPDGDCIINSAHYNRAAPWLASAGAGDVLAGFIVGLLARGMSVVLAARTAGWLHVECARNFGPGLIAEDLPEQLPQILARYLK